jgi:hypothetical protein
VEEAVDIVKDVLFADVAGLILFAAAAEDKV